MGKHTCVNKCLCIIQILFLILSDGKETLPIMKRLHVVNCMYVLQILKCNCRLFLITVMVSKGKMIYFHCIVMYRPLVAKVGTAYRDWVRNTEHAFCALSALYCIFCNINFTHFACRYYRQRSNVTKMHNDIWCSKGPFSSLLPS